MTVSAQFNVNYAASQVGDHTIIEPTFEPRISSSLTFEDGVGLNQADRQWVIERELAGAASDTITLDTGLKDAFGDDVDFAEIVGIMVVSDPANVATLSIGGGTGAWFGMFGAATDKIVLPPGGFFAIAAPGEDGLGAVAALANSLTFTNSHATIACDFKVAILGRSQ